MNMTTMWQDLIVFLAGAVLIGCRKMLVARVKAVWPAWRRKRGVKRTARTAARAQARAERTRRQIIETAESQGRIVPVSRSGRMPVVMTFSDGTHSAYFQGDFEAYVAAMRSGRYDPARTFHTHAPRIH